MRILNASRSPRANIHFFLKFGIRVELETVEIFRTRLYEYIKSKPREWLRPVAFRLSLIAADLGYAQYFILLTHRGKAFESSHTILYCILVCLSYIDTFSMIAQNRGIKREPS